MEAAEYHCSLSNPDKPSRPPKCRHNTHYTDSGKSVLRYLPFQTQHKPYNARQLRAGQSSITSPSRQNTNHTTQGNRGLGKPALLPLPERLQTTQHKATESWAKQHHLPFQTGHKPRNTRQQRAGQSSITSPSRHNTNHTTQGNRELDKAAACASASTVLAVNLHVDKLNVSTFGLNKILFIHRNHKFNK